MGVGEQERTLAVQVTHQQEFVYASSSTENFFFTGKYVSYISLFSIVSDAGWHRSGKNTGIMSLPQSHSPSLFNFIKLVHLTKYSIMLQLVVMLLPFVLAFTVCATGYLIFTLLTCIMQRENLPVKFHMYACL